VGCSNSGAGPDPATDCKAEFVRIGLSGAWLEKKIHQWRCPVLAAACCIAADAVVNKTATVVSR